MSNKTYPACPVETTISLIGSKWKLLILRDLFSGTKRFSELNKSLTGISKKMLTQQLRQLEDDGIIIRKIYPVVPPKVEYSLTENGQSLKPIIDAMRTWGLEFKEKIAQTQTTN